MPKVIYDNILGKLREGAQVGPAGPQGPKGDTGAAGPAGPQGEQGPPGRKRCNRSCWSTGTEGRQGRSGTARSCRTAGPQGKTGSQERGATRATGTTSWEGNHEQAGICCYFEPESPRQALYMSVTKSGPLPEAVSGMSALPRNMGYSPAMTAVHSISW